MMDSVWDQSWRQHRNILNLWLKNVMLVAVCKTQRQRSLSLAQDSVRCQLRFPTLEELAFALLGSLGIVGHRYGSHKPLGRQPVPAELHTTQLPLPREESTERLERIKRVRFEELQQVSSQDPTTSQFYLKHNRSQTNFICSPREKNWGNTFLDPSWKKGDLSTAELTKHCAVWRWGSPSVFSLADLQDDALKGRFALSYNHNSLGV